MRTFSMKDSKKDHFGHKTTITVTTENPEVIKSLMNTASEGEKRTTSNRTKSSKSNTSNKSKNSSKKKTKIQALPAPKPKPSDAVQNAAKGSLKKYLFVDNNQNVTSLTIYAPTRDKAIKLMAEVNKIMKTNYKIDVSVVRGQKLDSYANKLIQVTGLTVDNYHQKQIDQAKINAAKVAKKKETTKELEPPKKKEVKALSAPKLKGKTKKKTVAKKAPVKTMTNTSFVPKDETVIYSKGKWAITKKPIGGLYTYTLYEKDFCRAQLLFMPDDDHKAFKEFKDRIKE